MKFALKFVMALIVTTLLMLAFRALVFTVYTVRGTALEPCLVDGDRVLVNRWSYGLRAGGYGPFGYARWIGSQVERGDLVVFNNPDAMAYRLHFLAEREQSVEEVLGLLNLMGKVKATFSNNKIVIE